MRWDSCQPMVVGGSPSARGDASGVTSVRVNQKFRVSQPRSLSSSPPTLLPAGLAMQAGQVIATVPSVAPVADVVMQNAGFQNQHGEDPNFPQPAPIAPQPQVGPDTAGVGGMQGIETMRPDGIR